MDGCCTKIQFISHITCSPHVKVHVYTCTCTCISFLYHQIKIIHITVINPRRACAEGLRYLFSIVHVYKYTCILCEYTL